LKFSTYLLNTPGCKEKKEDLAIIHEAMEILADEVRRILDDIHYVADDNRKLKIHAEDEHP
jgi:hypothetical protein